MFGNVAKKIVPSFFVAASFVTQATVHVATTDKFSKNQLDQESLPLRKDKTIGNMSPNSASSPHTSLLVKRF